MRSLTKDEAAAHKRLDELYKARLHTSRRKSCASRLWLTQQARIRQRLNKHLRISVVGNVI